MAQATATQLKNSWRKEGGPKDSLGELYSEGLQQYWDWLGDSFYPLFGINDFGLAQPSDLSSDATQQELDYYIAAKDLSYKLNYINLNIFGVEREDGLSLADQNWPGDDTAVYDYVYYRSQVIPIFVNLIEDLKVIQENILISATDGFNNAFGSGPFAFGNSPPENLPELIDSVLDSAEEFLKLFPDVNISLKKDIAGLADTNGLGPAPIFSDINLESSLVFQTNQTHYIGFLINPEKSNGARSKSYLPIRLQPNTTGDNAPPLSPRGWQDPDYYLINNDGDPIKSANKIDNGVEVPLGLEITVTEIVQSETGVWVGFVSDDPRILDTTKITLFGPEGGTTLGNNWDDNITAGQTRVIYTKSHFVRIKESAISKEPDPYISQLTKFAVTGEDPSSQALKIEAASPFDPAGMNWVKRPPNDVRLEYYSFWKYNKKVIAEGDEENLIFNTDTLDTVPTLKYSEGYFYFVTGEAPRRNEAEIINESDQDLDSSSSEMAAAKSAAGATSFETIKQEAWKNLLAYLGKNTKGGNSVLYEQLYKKYFVLAASKLHTKSVNPNNQKAMFAIRSSYIDPLPTKNSPINEDFEPESPFLTGKTYHTSMKVNDIKKRVKHLVGDLRTIESKSKKQTIQNANGTDYNIDMQITALESLPDILDDFLRRQSFPNSSERSFIYEMAGEGVDTKSNHVIQIGIKDNSEIGGNVRETISYVLFAPDIKSLETSTLRGFDVGGSNLYYFDPYLKGETISDGVTRSAIPLKIGLNLLRSKLEGNYLSRALHLLLSYPAIRPKLQKAKLDIQDDKWMEYLSQFVVPPVKIYLSKLPDPLIEEDTIDCDELIEKINKLGPNSTKEDRLLEEQLYNSPKCREQYFNSFNKNTHAGSPDLSKKELEKKAEFTESKSGGSNEYLSILYSGFFNILDMDSLMAMIMACISKKLGMEFTAEAICEAAIVELIKNIGPSPVEQAMLANALLSPGTPASQNFLAAYQDAPPFVTPDSAEANAFAESLEEEGLLVIDDSFGHAPLAAAMLMSKKSSSVVKVVKQLESTGAQVNLIPGKRPITDPGNIYLPYGSSFLNMLGAPGENVLLNERYSQTEIDNEKERLKSRGYTASEARALLVQHGFLDIDPVQYQDLISNGNFSAPANNFANKIQQQQFSSAANVAAAEDLRAAATDAENWLNYMKGAIGLQSICELIVGEILDGLKELITDPGAFFSGGGSGWWDDFKEKLKKQFVPPPMTFKFPDNLITDSHMGDYERQLAKMVVTMISTILGQIVSLLIKDALEKCLEEDDDMGPGGRRPNSPPDIPIPTLDRANLPRITGIPDSDIVAWMKDIIDNLSTAQLCALLRGDATKQTLRACLTRTKSLWYNIYLNGIDTIYEIRVAFEKIGQDLNLNICEVSQSPLPLTLVSNICDAFFDRDSRCEQLKLGGLTEEECQKQIDRELNDLREKVIALTRMSLFNMTPFSNSLPPICGDNGSFVVPPGVADTMERVTSNMLTALKGSLMIDMNALKFFATPPRALLAMSDPNELMNAHSVFTSAIKNPYKKRCIALIADSYSLRQYDGAPSVEIYPFTYNNHIHYGNFSTWRSRNESVNLSTLSQKQQEEVVAKATVIAEEKRQKRIAKALEDIENKADDWRTISSAGTRLVGSIEELAEVMLEENVDAQEKLALAEFKEASGAEKAKYDKIRVQTLKQNIPRQVMVQAALDIISAEGITNATLIQEELENRVTTQQFWESYESLEVQGNITVFGIFAVTALKKQSTDVVLGGEFVTIAGIPLSEYIPNQAWRNNFYTYIHELYDEALEYYMININEQYESELAIHTDLERDKLMKSVDLDEVNQLFILEDADLKEDVQNYWKDGEHSTPNDFFEQEEIIPMNLISLANPEGLVDIPHVLRRLPQDDRTQQTAEAYLEKYKNQSNREALSNTIKNEFKAEQKPTYLDVLSVDYKQTITKNVDNGGVLEAGRNYIYGTNFIGNIHNTNKKDRRLRRSWALNTKLKDISEDPRTWWYMLRNYTGIQTWHTSLNRDPITALVGTVLYTTIGMFDKFDPDDIAPFLDAIPADVFQNAGALSWANFFAISPGLRKIFPIMLERHRDDKRTKFKDNFYELAYAFMELTLAEASGIEYDRIKNFFPNISPSIDSAEVVLGSSNFMRTTVIKPVGSISTANGFKDLTEDNYSPTSFVVQQYYPHFIIFDKPFRDPSSIFNKGADEIVNHFSGDLDLVNKELYDFLSNEFPKSLGSASNTTTMAHKMGFDSNNLESTPNFNPNILKHALPFTEASLKGATGVDTNKVAQEITKLFSDIEGSSQANEIANSIQMSQLNRSLVYQNVASSDFNPLTAQLNEVKDTSRIIKAAVRNLPNNKQSPPFIIPDIHSLTKEIYDFNFVDNFSPSVKNLVDSIYDGGATAENILNNYNESIFPILDYRLKPESFQTGLFQDDKKKQEATNFAVALEPYNFKAQIFGQLLTKKFGEQFLEFYEPENISEDNKNYVNDNMENFTRHLNTVLSTYGYSALQYAYSTQMYTKLKHSRLHSRAFMKKLWNKILKSPLTSEVDPRCQDIFDQLGAPSTKDMNKTETDFFQLDQVKPMIIEFYNKSLCYDVYEKGNEDDNAARVSLIEGMVLLIAKVYTLEMCLASLIAWDSFDFEDVLKDKSFIHIIIQNISQDFDLEFVSFFANDILKKNESLTELDLAKIRTEQSSIEYMIKKEAERIGSIVKQMFSNSNPLSTDLKLDILKNSDPDFIHEARYSLGAPEESQSDSDLAALAALHSERGYEIVHDARFKNNIYTMNYGSPQHYNYFKSPAGAGIDAQGYSDLFGHLIPNSLPHRFKGNKNYLHSLPMTYYTDSDYESGYHDKTNEAAINTYLLWKNQVKIYKDPIDSPGEYDYIKNLNSLQKSAFLRSDSFSKENNPENTHGNAMNAKLGNILFQPYVKIEDYQAGEDRDFIVNIYSEVEENGKPCDGATLLGAVNINNFNEIIETTINLARQEAGNVLNCHIYGVVPLSAWSYYFKNNFLKTVTNYTDPQNGTKPLMALYQRYGYKPFFKKISLGMRMTYTTSYPAIQSPKFKFNEFMKKAFTPKPGFENNLKKAKCMLGQRVYHISDTVTDTESLSSGKILPELQIPIVSIEKEIKPTSDGYGFTVGESDIYSFSELGRWTGQPLPGEYNTVSQLISLGQLNNITIEDISQNTHQFYYKNLANSFLTDIKNSSEFKLMFETLFPMKSYMGLAAIVASDGLSKFIPEPTVVLEETKDTLKMIIDNLVKSTDYKHVPDPVANFLQDFALRNEGGTTGKDKDLTKEILKIVLRTPLLILKGLVEITDPAVMVSKLIIDLSNAAVLATLTAIQTGIRITKQTIEAGIQTAEQQLLIIEMNLSTSLAPAKIASQSLPNIKGINLSDFVIIDVEAGSPITNDDGTAAWNDSNFSIEELPQDVKQDMSDEQLDSWNAFKQQFNQMKQLVKDYTSAASKLKDLQNAKDEITDELEKAVKDAEEVLKSVFQSPFLLPGIWASLVPAMMYMGGGIIPPPFPGGPFPSTVPGMIYLALLLIDAIEEKTHEDINKLGEEPNCADQL